MVINFNTTTGIIKGVAIYCAMQQVKLRFSQRFRLKHSGGCFAKPIKLLHQ